MEERLQKLEKQIMDGNRSALLEYVRLQKRIFWAEHKKLVQTERN